jgi:predicted deacetylase
MQPNEKLRALCVSVHDVSPCNWHLCQRLVQGIEEVAHIPVTLLGVPHFHRLPFADAGAYRGWLERRAAGGDELALHGYVHLDEGPPPADWRERFRRNVFTLREGEFSALDRHEAKRRLEMGVEWFEKQGWNAEGFVAPAWMMSDGAWQALRDFPFRYTTTMRRFYVLPQQRGLLSPSIVYSARNAGGRWLSRGWNSALSATMADSTLIRVSLHPRDAQYPHLIAHYQRLIGRFLDTRKPMTKAAFSRIAY